MTLPITTPGHRTLIELKIPDWMKKAPAAAHQSMRNALATPPRWLEAARQSKPEVLTLLLQEHARHREAEVRLKTAMRPLPSLEAFAVPRLTRAIEQRFSLQLDVRRTYLFNAKKAAAFKRSMDSSKEPFVSAQLALKQATQSLLHCALQNFEASEAEPGGLDQDRLQSRVLDSAEFSVHVPQGRRLAIAAHAFADLCRELDLGGEYQRLIAALQAPGSGTGINARIQAVERSAFGIRVHLAYLQGLIPADVHERLMQMQHNAPDDGAPACAVQCNFLTLWEVELTGILIFGQDRDKATTSVPVVVYIPDDPVCPLQRYDSTLAFVQELRERLRDADYLHFFKRFIPARHLAHLLAKLQDHLTPWTRRAGMAFSERVAAPKARLHLRDGRALTDWPGQLAGQKMRRLTDDALFHAVPTAKADEKAFDERLAHFAQALLTTLNTAAFFVPALGTVMLGVATFSLAYEVYEGFESWAQEEQAQALAYLLDVAENLALMAALGAAGNPSGPAAIERLTVETPSFIEELRQVQMPDGQTRLWKPDLAPFAHDIVLPGDLKPNEFGLYEHQGKTWLALEDRAFSVQPTTHLDRYALVHPTKRFGYQPTARHNGAGAWVAETEEPLDWQGEQLWRRMGLHSAGLSAETAQRLLRITDTSEAVLRHALSENRRLPALLEDALWRLRLDESVARTASEDTGMERAARFEQRYRTSAATASPRAEQLHTAYPDVPERIRQELLRELTPTELRTLDAGSLPARLVQEMAAYLPNIRLTRAYEGLYLQSVHNVDSDTLALHTLAQLPDWPKEMRIEIRDGNLNGPILDSVGRNEAPLTGVLARGIDGYITNAHTGLPAQSLFEAISHVMPPARRDALGRDAGQALRNKARQAPLMPRAQLRTLLGMPARRPGFVPPMRLADGRVGYLLSGRGATAGYILRETLLDTLRLLGMEEHLPLRAEDALRMLEDSGMTRAEILSRFQYLLEERQTLRAALARWTDASASLADIEARAQSRSHIGDAIWSHWYATSLLELGTVTMPLRLRQAYITDVPLQLPGFVYERTRHLELVDMVLDAPGGIAPFDLGAIEPLRALLGRFNRLTSLEISRVYSSHYDAPPFPGLVRVITDTLPELRTLRLVNQQLLGGPDDFTALRGLTSLHTLDLSGNSLYWSAPAAALRGMPLRHLGLERASLDRWPQWLDSTALDAIDSLSLRDNGISNLPDFLLARTADSPHTTAIALQGNSLLPAQVQRIAMNSSAQRPRFDLSIEMPEQVRQSLNQLRDELEQLREAIEQWTHSSNSSTVLSAQATAARTLLGTMIVDFWQAFRTGQSHLPLNLTEASLEHFPRQLPAFFHQNIRHLVLTRVIATPAQLNAFLAQFRSLRELELSGHVQPMTTLPTALFDMPALHDLSLRDQGLLIDQSVLDDLGRLPALASLDLTGNRLGAIAQAPASLIRSLQRLYLSNTHLQIWPAWLDDVLPLSLLDLDGNQLTTLPDPILDNPRSLDLQTEISLRDNPLTRETMTQAHVSEGFNRSYRFNMDLPADIEALSPENGSEDSNFGSPVHSHASTEQDQVALHMDPWLRGTPEENEAHRRVWEQLENEIATDNLLRLIQRLQQTAPFRDSRTRDGFSERVWQVLESAQQSADERQLYNAMAESALVQADGSQTCHDGALLVFNQIELRMFNERSLQGVNEPERGTALQNLMRRMFRLETLDNIALQRLAGRDQAEVRLVYRLRLAQALDLPVPPSSMLYEATAAVRSNELGEVLAEVQRREQGAQFLDYAAAHEAWGGYLRSTHAKQFEEIEQLYQQRVTELPDRYPGRAIEELADEFSMLEREKQAQEQALIRELTNQLSH